MTGKQGMKEKLPRVTIYTDGAARGNPDGPGGYGAVLLFTDSAGNLHKKEMSGGYRRTTNNRMELMAAIVSLETLNRPCSVTLHSDSKYLTDAFNKNWIYAWMRSGWKKKSGEAVKNIDLWQRLIEAAKPHKIMFVWVKGHDGDPLNERCDALATGAADGSILQDDPGV